MATTFLDALKRKGGGEGAKAMLRHLRAKLSGENFDRFLNSTPDGDDFWPAYISRKFTKDEPDKYGYDQFAADVLRLRG
ncbi:MAG: hypothetical protein A2534_00310 [Candidatus Magasanikbacteria bacterium RIFOXYD2_FULL_39_9]|uniref:Uncharacterized protein n=1 Tax=Candidatus Magasanikbacteria bacterium RIFOXYD1_FULL_40_23 TaxID=1798705 RepID=A0A1F6P9C6_9BACT|nr:MAG: hypothetical protein A2534_00310 [Candidatus Magasanikbacteria bacterium RIFOXYD2_FULL_39_9]OGH92772.1 MAG: hypothetical protein A2563_03835 [Candidatus Magasanikbacteria bacterium RIFOXYD1_FULL_40_23]